MEKQERRKVDEKALQVVRFSGGELRAFKDEEGRIWVQAKPVAEALGLDWKSQYMHLQRDEVLKDTMVIMTIVSPHPRNPEETIVRETVFIERQGFVLWLAKLQPSRVKDPERRRKIIAYQKEAGKALEDYFFRGAAVNPRAMMNPELLKIVIGEAVARSVGELKELLKPQQEDPVLARFKMAKEVLESARKASVSPGWLERRYDELFRKILQEAGASVSASPSVDDLVDLQEPAEEFVRDFEPEALPVCDLSDDRLAEEDQEEEVSSLKEPAEEPVREEARADAEDAGKVIPFRKAQETAQSKKEKETGKKNEKKPEGLLDQKFNELLEKNIYKMLFLKSLIAAGVSESHEDDSPSELRAQLELSKRGFLEVGATAKLKQEASLRWQKIVETVMEEVKTGEPPRDSFACFSTTLLELLFKIDVATCVFVLTILHPLLEDISYKSVWRVKEERSFNPLEWDLKRFPVRRRIFLVLEKAYLNMFRKPIKFLLKKDCYSEIEAVLFSEDSTLRSQSSQTQSC